mmetsp:Transcript_99521/g.309459  ORF Transcript_99521/g.309459 Transcript_99521/m.309459 type:complete len:215 (-) Transcript_99521:429-1073(-)
MEIPLSANSAKTKKAMPTFTGLLSRNGAYRSAMAWANLASKPRADPAECCSTGLQGHHEGQQQQQRPTWQQGHEGSGKLAWIRSTSNTNTHMNMVSIMTKFTTAHRQAPVQKALSAGTGIMAPSPKATALQSDVRVTPVPARSRIFPVTLGLAFFWMYCVSISVNALASTNMSSKPKPRERKGKPETMGADKLMPHRRMRPNEASTERVTICRP